ncbi:hypothetical protein RFI_10344, partial [Reticulomyxa filosa]
IVKNDKKERYLMEKDTRTGEYRIRCNQGHSLKTDGCIQLKNEALLHHLSLAELQSKIWKNSIFHGTNESVLKEIVSSGGLSRMKRRHIHFAFTNRENNRHDVLIYVDVVAAIKDGFAFFISTNNVILTEGNEKGFLSCKYFTKIVKITNKTTRTIWEKGHSPPLDACFLSK